jgi:hypothetical protein
VRPVVIIEGILTTRDPDGKLHAAAMGLTVLDAWHEVELRPFVSTQTWLNLKREPYAVFHVLDDAELLVEAALGYFSPTRQVHQACCVPGYVLEGTCRWYELHGLQANETQARAALRCRVVHRGWKRDFCGWNRAQFAVVESAILATRLELLPADVVKQDIERWRTLVEKTGGDKEKRAMEFVVKYLDNWYRAHGVREEIVTQSISVT